MKVAVITPYYEGRKHLNSYADFIKKNAESLEPNDQLTVIFVNDSPWEDISPTMGFGCECVILENEKNVGIHASRVAGLKKAKAMGADYVIFLDQDDELTKDAVVEFLDAARKSAADIYISNAMLEKENWEDRWIRSEYQAGLIWDMETFLNVGTQIISPGQCMIDIRSIPDIWCEKILTKNGADDFFLWLLMLSEKKRHMYIDKPLYRHVHTGQNISDDTNVTDESVYSFIEILKSHGALSEGDCNRLKTMISYKGKFRQGSLFTKLITSLLHPVIFSKNLVYKLRSGTKYGFNR